MFALLNIDKPAGLTSRDVVNRVQRLVRPHKVGHAGTLDPLATGVLIVALGPATRLVEYVQRMAKTYQGTFLLGRTSDTEDITGSVTELPAAKIPSHNEIMAAIPPLLGTIQQRPPAYSALKIQGQSAYKLARRGEEFSLAARPITVHSIEIVRYRYPELELLVRCGSGTYIRSLGRDLAGYLGSGAVMSALRRLAIGPFKVEDALKCDDLSADAISSHLLPSSAAVTELPAIELNGTEVTRAMQGQVIERPGAPAAPELAAYDEQGNLVAILNHSAGKLTPQKCFLPSAAYRSAP
jgi:tRNA pseudouridine55 synthase